MPTPGPLVTACRGCCCGTTRKHPGVDHDVLLARLRDGIGSHGRVRTSDCLGPCELSNVVVVTPSPAGRARGARPVWVRGVLDHETVDDLVAWIHAGGPGVAGPPPVIEVLAFPVPPRRS